MTMIIKMIVVIWFLAIAKNELCPMNLCFVYSKCPRKREKKREKENKTNKNSPIESNQLMRESSKQNEKKTAPISIY